MKKFSGHLLGKRFEAPLVKLQSLSRAPPGCFSKPVFSFGIMGET